MEITNYLDKKLIFLNLEANSKIELIEKMLKQVANADKNVKANFARIKTGILTREDEFSTALGNGVLVPHARIKDFNDFVIAIATIKGDVVSELASGKGEENIRVAVMLISDILNNKKMLKVLSLIAKLNLQRPEMTELVLNATSEEQIYNLIDELHFEIDDKITAKDVLSPDVKPVLPSDTLENIAVRLILEEKTGLPVVDKENNFLGEITEKELIAFGMPDYTETLSDLSFLTVGEPFEDYLKNECHTTVDEIYKTKTKDVPTIDEDTSIMEICFLLIRKSYHRIYVTNRSKYVGTISRSDIIKKVLHI